MKARRVLLACVPAAAVTLIGASVWFDASHVSEGECVNQEAVDYPHLEQVAQEVVGTLSDRVRRYSFCEDAGIPGAAVRVSVYDWSNRTQARDFLSNLPLAEPYSANPDSDDRFLAHGVVIQYIKTVDHLENDGRSYVTVVFSAPR